LVASHKNGAKPPRQWWFVGKNPHFLSSIAALFTWKRVDFLEIACFQNALAPVYSFTGHFIFRLTC
jgi:hypothetical protein